MTNLANVFPVLVVALIVSIAFVKSVPLFSEFIKGAKEGIDSAVSIMPTLIGILVGISMLNSSGAIDAISNLLSPVCQFFNIPVEVVPLAVIRPISGSGASSALINIFENEGPDSIAGQIGSVLSASTDTTFYAISIYFGAKHYKSLLHTLPCALFGDFVAMGLAVISVRLANFT